MKPCKACKWYVPWNNGCDKWKIILSQNEKHDVCFERKNPIKNPLGRLKQPHTEKE